MNELRPAVLFLGTALLLCTLGIIALAALEVSIPDVLTNLAVGDLTALAALLRPVGTSTPPQHRESPGDAG